MAAKSEASKGKAFVYTREISAPRDLVWKAWTEGEHLAQWWGPKGMKVAVKKSDIRPGGTFHYSMEAPDGTKMYGLFQYRELKPTERIVWLNSFADAKGLVARAPFPGKVPLEMHNTVTLAEKKGKTLVHLHSVPHNATPEECAFFEGMFKSMEGGFGGTFDQLETYLAKAPECKPHEPVYEPTTKLSNTFKLELRGDREIYMERQFDAPKRLVFLAHSKAEYMRNWWGPREFKTTYCELDFRVGGKWRIGHRGPDGVEYRFHGEYREIVKDERITWTFEFEGMPGIPADNLAVETMSLEEKNGKTTLKVSSIAPSKEARDGMAQSGMEWGARQTFDRLDELVTSMK